MTGCCACQQKLCHVCNMLVVPSCLGSPLIGYQAVSGSGCTYHALSQQPGWCSSCQVSCPQHCPTLTAFRVLTHAGQSSNPDTCQQGQLCRHLQLPKSRFGERQHAVVSAFLQQVHSFPAHPIKPFEYQILSLVSSQGMSVDLEVLAPRTCDYAVHAVRPAEYLHQTYANHDHSPFQLI